MKALRTVLFTVLFGAMFTGYALADVAFIPAIGSPGTALPLIILAAAVIIAVIIIHNSKKGKRK